MVIAQISTGCMTFPAEQFKRYSDDWWWYFACGLWEYFTILHISASVKNALPTENCSMDSKKLISEDRGLGVDIKVNINPPSFTLVLSNSRLYNVKAVKNRYSRSTPLNFGTLFRCCVLGQGTLPSHSSLGTGVNE